MTGTIRLKLHLFVNAWDGESLQRVGVKGRSEVTKYPSAPDFVFHLTFWPIVAAVAAAKDRVALIFGRSDVLFVILRSLPDMRSRCGNSIRREMMEAIMETVSPCKDCGKSFNDTAASTSGGSSGTKAASDIL